MCMDDGADALNFVGVSEMTSAWTADQVSRIAELVLPAIPLVTAHDTAPVLPGFDLWDLWPVQTLDGRVADLDGWAAWMILSAPVLPNPNDRHDIARIRLVLEKAGQWRDCGNLFPDGHCPGSREWAGSALYDPDTQRLTSFHTAAGRRGSAPTFEQRIFQTSATLTCKDGFAHADEWSVPEECFQSDGDHYVQVNQSEGIPGHIKGFRDPAHFHDPADGADYILFTGSLGCSTSAWNGVIGIARSTTGQHDAWELLPPIVSADGLNNEQERPHVILRDGLYYLFWSTQQKVFAPGGPSGPTGLYGMVAPSILGPYKPLNETGLVAPNPDNEPSQTYSWWVTDRLEVAGFVDHWGLKGRSVTDEPALLRGQFGGTPAPRFRLALKGETAHIVQS
jgi:levansucrase